MRLNWTYKETRDAEIAKCKVYPFFVTVMDCDGDFSEWRIEKHRQEVARGGSDSNSPYHFDVAKKEAVDALKPLVRDHLQRLENDVKDLRAALGTDIH